TSKPQCRAGTRVPVRAGGVKLEGQTKICFANKLVPTFFILYRGENYECKKNLRRKKTGLCC
ncbi:hypothetical protein SAMN02910369_03114, partial [Lachnospiraceae bacterium NE2001]